MEFFEHNLQYLPKVKDNYKLIQEGLPGRLAGSNEKEKVYKNGKDTFISTFRTNAPVDKLIIALGTNDLQFKYNKTGEDIINDLLWYKEVLEQMVEDEDDKKKYFVNNELPEIIYILPSNFDYKENGFGPIFDDDKKLINEVKKIVKEPKVSERYLKRINSFFELNDANNSMRIFDEITKLKK